MDFAIELAVFAQQTPWILKTPTTIDLCLLNTCQLQVDAGLCSELKQLYVLITRAKHCVLFHEEQMDMVIESVVLSSHSSFHFKPVATHLKTNTCLHLSRPNQCWICGVPRD